MARGVGVVLAVLLPVVVSGCGGSASLAPSSRADPAVGDAIRPSFAQFTDIPMPDGATMDLDRTLILGSQGSWVGRLVLGVRTNAGALFDFYRSEMLKFGWQELTAVQSETSVLAYRNGARIASISIQAGTLAAPFSPSKVNFLVSPAGSQGGPMGMPSSMGMPPAGDEVPRAAPLGAPVYRGR
ncbi:MAG: hypothetical protein ABT940_11490 [Alphaproteobacteria bacterium]